MSAYSRALRLQHVRLAGWQRELLSWGMVALAVLLALTGLLSPWGILVLPLLAAAVVKAHDSLTGRLASAAAAFRPDSSEPPIQRTGGSD
ncbi:MAG TPA: hypothetical protein VLR26_08715 [Frankiaceae bacterium]|nr:hypothetical protein [Frankiaceae bacterium]